MTLQNLHTHTIYCDGKNTFEEMIEAAIEKGFASLGFSPHSYMPFDKKTGISVSDDKKYKAELKNLKKKYKDRIEIYTGLEYELYSDHKIEDYDYVIGSCHYLMIDNKEVLIDCSLERTENIIDTYFEGDGLKLARAYYETIVKLADVYPFDIIGHFDVITKHIETKKLFDVNCKQYQNYALEALHALGEKFKIFEVNTGAIARSGRTIPYPQDFILKEILDMGAYVTVSSDCHRKETMDMHYKESFELLKQCGFKEIMIFDGKGFKSEPIQ